MDAPWRAPATRPTGLGQAGYNKLAQAPTGHTICGAPCAPRMLGVHTLPACPHTRRLGEQASPSHTERPAGWVELHSDICSEGREHYVAGCSICSRFCPSVCIWVPVVVAVVGVMLVLWAGGFIMLIYKPGHPKSPQGPSSLFQPASRAVMPSLLVARQRYTRTGHTHQCSFCSF